MPGWRIVRQPGWSRALGILAPDLRGDDNEETPGRGSDLGPWRAARPPGDRDGMDGVPLGRAGLDEDGAWWAWPLEFAGRACCCPAMPVTVVVMPPADGRPYPVDLLLCAHHYRASIVALLATGAAVYDMGGVVIPAARRPAPAAHWPMRG